MSFPGTPAYSGIFLPEIWSARINYKYYDGTVLSEIANTNWEGEVSDMGEKVKIRQRPTIIVRDYTKSSQLQYQQPTAPIVELELDKGKYWATALDDVDAAQTDLDLMDEFAEDASEQVKIAVDTDVLGNVYADAAAQNSGNSAGRISGDIQLGATGAFRVVDKSNILDMIVDAGTVLDEQNVPETGRWIVLPAAMCGMIKKSDLKDASLAGDGTSIMRNGRLGIIDRFQVFSSNLLSFVDDGGTRCWNAMAGHPSALTYALQVTKVQRLVGESSFHELMRGLAVYGYKTNLSTGLAHLYLAKG